MNAPAAARILDTGQQEVLTVEGMHCGSCAAAVETLLRRQPGVIEAAVNFAADSAFIHWDNTQTDLKRLQQVVNRFGYQLSTAAGQDARDRQADKIRRSLQWRLAVAVVFGMWSMMPALLIYLEPYGGVEPEAVWPLALASGLFAVPVLLYSGSHFYRVGWRTLLVGVPGLDTLITAAVISACIISTWQLALGHSHVYFDAAVMLITFQLVARLLDVHVRRRAADIVRGYLQEAPEEAIVINASGERQKVAAADIAVGQHIVLSENQQLALDCVVSAGQGQADMALLTGEHLPQPLTTGDPVLAGCRLLEGELLLLVTAAVGQRRIDTLARAVRGLLSRKTALQRLTDRMARAILPIITVAAVIAVLLALLQGLPLSDAAARGLAVLIISCPCALSLAIPLVIIMGHARMVTNGIVLRDPAALETAADVTTVIFDKTGTLTTGEPRVASVIPSPGWSQKSLLQLAADTLQDSLHPVAKGIAATCTPATEELTGHRENITGLGTRWYTGEQVVLAGRASWLQNEGVNLPEVADEGMILHLACDHRYAGHITFEEQIRPESRATIGQLLDNNYTVYMLSGDTRQACLRVAEELQIPPTHVVAEVTPEQKGTFIANLERNSQGVAFVGDGLNDGLALAGARLGIAIDKAVSAAHSAAAVYLPDGPGQVPATLQLARRARKLMYQNLTWAIGYNALVLPLAIAGWVQPVIAAIAMTASSLCVLVNSLRMQR